MEKLGVESEVRSIVKFLFVSCLVAFGAAVLMGYLAVRSSRSLEPAIRDFLIAFLPSLAVLLVSVPLAYSRGVKRYEDLVATGSNESEVRHEELKELILQSEQHLGTILEDRWRLERAGIQEVYPARTDINDNDLVDRIKNADEIDLLGCSQFELIGREDFQKAVASHLRTGRKCRVLLMDSKSDEVHRRQTHERENEDLSGLVACSIKTIRSICDKTGSNISDVLRCYDHRPTCMIIRIDDYLVVTFYVWGKAARSPAMVLRPSRNEDSWFGIYKKHFEEEWASAMSELEDAEIQPAITGSHKLR